MLDGQARAAGLVEHTHAGGVHAQPVAQRRFECLHVDIAHIVAHPFVEDRCSGSGRTAPGRPTVPRRRVPSWYSVSPSSLMRSTTGMNCIQLRAHLVAQETVHLQRIVAVDPVDRGQDVVLHPVLLQQAQCRA